MVKRNKPEDGPDVRVHNKDFKVAITNMFRDLKEKMVTLRE